MGWVSWVFFCFVCPRLEPEGTNNQRGQWAFTTLKSPNKSLLCLAKGPGKGHPGKTEIFKTVTTLLQRHITAKNTMAHPHQEGPSGESTFAPSLGYKAPHPPPPISSQSGIREGQVGRQDIHHHWAVTRPPPAKYSAQTSIPTWPWWGAPPVPY